MPDPDRNRRALGLGCLIVASVLGGLVFLIELLSATFTDSGAATAALILGFVPVVLYLAIPRLLDRFDPEPWWALAGVFTFSALFATGGSGIVNTLVQINVADVYGKEAGNFAAATFSAPIVEELLKGMAVWGIVVFVRREFDGIVDGIIYGTFAGIGFAAVENVSYYFNYREQMGVVFLVRAGFSPWIHPLFTSMTGIGFGLGREHGAGWAKVAFPFFGYVAGVLLHAIWNGTSFFMEGTAQLLIKCLVGFLFAIAFIVIVIILVRRKGATIRKFLRDEVLTGHMTQQEVDLIGSAWGRMRASSRWGAVGRDFVRAGSKLALSKWHTARAVKGSKKTISADFIVPLRQEIAQLRQRMGLPPPQA